MEERVTVTVESGLEPERKAALGRAVAEAFGLSEAEGQALLAADALVLAPAEARELAVLGQQLGIAVSLASAPLRRPWQRGRWLAGAALLAVVAVVAAALSVRGPGSSAPAALAPLPALAREGGEIEPLPPGAAPEEEAPDLFAAAREQGAAELRRALAAAPQVDLRDAYGQTPLMYAAGSNDAEVVALLIASGAQPNARSDAGWTPLMYAARNQAHPEVATTLLEAGADPAARNASGQSARDIALAYNNEAVSALLPEEALAEPAAQETVQDAAQPSAEQPGAAAPSEAVARLESAPPAPAPAPRRDPSDPSRQIIERCLADWAACGRE